MLFRLAHVALLAAGVVLTPPIKSAVSPFTFAADRLVDSVGVNIHLHYDRTLYRDQFPLVKSRLLELGVRHVRDGLEDTQWRGYYERHNELGQAGIKGTFITSPGQSVDLWRSWPSRVPDSFEAYEGPNEMDKQGPNRRSDWASVLRDTVRRLHTVKEDARAASYPIYGPSLTTMSAFAALGDVSEHYDYANLHNYYAGRHPATSGWGRGGYGSIGWNLALTTRYAPGKPVVTTETGYQDSPSAVDNVPRDVVGRYMPIMLLEHLRAGIVRTFLYELADFPRSGGYGMLEQDGAPKPAFTAVKSLLNLLNDPGPPHEPAALAYDVDGDSADTRHLAFQKRNGVYYVAVWRSRPSYDPPKRKALGVAPQTVRLTVPRELRQARVHQWQIDGSLATTEWSTIDGAVNLAVADRLAIVEVARDIPEGGR